MIRELLFFSAQPSLWVQLSHLYMTTGKTIALTIQTCEMKISPAKPINKECHSHQWFLASKCESVQFSRSVVSDSWTAACPASLSITNCRSLPKPMSIESVMPSNHLILCHPLVLLPSIFPSIRVFSNESALHIRWPKYWSFKLQHQSFQWTPRTNL